METSQSLPGALKMDEGAAVHSAEDQRYTGHAQALLCLAFLDDRLLFSSSADLSIKASKTLFRLTFDPHVIMYALQPCKRCPVIVCLQAQQSSSSPIIAPRTYPEGQAQQVCNAWSCA
jgi:hypothetical protein